MGASRVTPAEIVEMYRLYAKLGSYAAVGREMGRSGSTVARYIKMEGTPPIVKHTFSEVVREGDKTK
ncbi:helix-turn-helix domain-containing protein [Candidatus Heritagella caecorum]|jgi:DNA invertase Pin-like site-specific DNA recombinase|uniref:Helix-turn-helix domain-containing protein n=1 Tax=Pseudoflavonifractor capillosus TaxID=106588 RepID=A0A921SSK7_9FIRM|nr:helix-turn-helix domain-containing protein [Pseudoflavonifractor capillosus]